MRSLSKFSIRGLHSQAFIPAKRVAGFGASVFSEFTPLAVQHKAVNLGQGFPDWDPPAFAQNAATRAIKGHANQYCRSIGHIPLVEVLAQLYSPSMKRELHPLQQIVVTAGATEAGFATMQAIVNPGDEVICIEPFYDMYPAQASMAGATVKFVPLRAPENVTSASEFTLDLEELERTITPKTRALWLNTPHNPLGKMFTRFELEAISKIVLKHPNLLVVSDEVYDYITFDKTEHIRIASLPGMWNRTITLGSAGKTFSVTGWKIGWVIAPESICHAVHMAHQWIPFCVTTPLQEAVSHMFKEAMKGKYFQELRDDFQGKRDKLMKALEGGGLKPIKPQGGYFVIADSSNMQVQVNNAEHRDYAIARYLTREVGVAPIPPSAFYSAPNKPLAKNFLRFAFCKSDKLLDEATVRLAQLRHL